MSTRPQVISLTVGTVVFVALTGVIWFSAHRARANEESALAATEAVDLKRVFLVHNVTDPEPEKTLRTEMSGGLLAIGGDVIDVPKLVTRLTTDDRYREVDVVLVKTSSEEDAWGAYLRIRNAVQSTGREAFFYRGDGPCECTERDMVTHLGVRKIN